MADLTFSQTAGRTYSLSSSNAAANNGFASRSSSSPRDSFVDIDREELKKVADDLGKGTSALNFAPQVIVKKFNGEVQCITYSAGILDAAGDSRQKVKGDVNALIQTNLDERARIKKQYQIG